VPGRWEWDIQLPEVGPYSLEGTSDYLDPAGSLSGGGGFVLALSLMATNVGYAREHASGFWYANVFTSPVETIGFVRRVSANEWDSFCGTGPRARRVGYAFGRDATEGAIALLISETSAAPLCQG
jgi:hypothetical protein